MRGDRQRTSLGSFALQPLVKSACFPPVEPKVSPVRGRSADEGAGLTEVKGISSRSGD